MTEFGWRINRTFNPLPSFFLALSPVHTLSPFSFNFVDKRRAKRVEKQLRGKGDKKKRSG